MIEAGKNVVLPLLSEGIVCLLESHTSALTCVHTLVYERVFGPREEKINDRRGRFLFEVLS